jgi:hypothetical protein
VYENNKLDEAGFFYSRMISEVDDRQSFIYHFSAFLSSARSVLQYALSEVESKKGKMKEGKQWYLKMVSSSPVLSFFKAERNINIHEKPVKPLRHLIIEPPPLVIHLSFSATVVICDKNGNVIHQEEATTPEPKSKQINAPEKVEIKYTFADWKGNEDVLTLSKMYLDELRKIVEDGVKNGFLTG